MEELLNEDLTQPARMVVRLAFSTGRLILD